MIAIPDIISGQLSLSRDIAHEWLQRHTHGDSPAKRYARTKPVIASATSNATAQANDVTDPPERIRLTFTREARTKAPFLAKTT
jgi:hypothetical protein